MMSILHRIIRPGDNRMNTGISTIQWSASFSAQVVSDSKPHNDIIRVALAIIECINLCAKEACCKALYGTLKFMNDAFASVGWTARSYDLFSGKALWDRPIEMQGKEFPNPFLFASRVSYYAADLGAVANFSSTMGWLDLGQLAENVGRIPLFGSALKYGVENIPIVRSTFGLLGNFFDTVDCVRVIIVKGAGRAELFRLAGTTTKIAANILFGFQALWLRFLSQVLNGISASISLVNLATK